jgi:hypothetical protein
MRPSRVFTAFFLWMALLYAFGWVVYGESGLKLTLKPQALIVGNSTWLTCRVNPDHKNRKLIFGIAGSGREGSERSLEPPVNDKGEPDWSKVAVTWGPYEFKKIPCDAGPAYCIVERQGERPLQEILPLNVGGCEGTK